MISAALFEEGPLLSGELLYGCPERYERGRVGRLAVLPDDAFVLYQLTTRRVQTFLVHGLGDTSVPGMRPGVNLLAHAQNVTESRRLVQSVNWLAAHDLAPETLGDGVWLRLSALLSREAYGVRDLRSVLGSHA